MKVRQGFYRSFFIVFLVTLVVNASLWVDEGSLMKVEAKEFEGSIGIFDCGNLQEVLNYLAAGSDVDARDSKGQNLLMCAILSDADLAVIDKILAAGVDVNHVDDDGYTSLLRILEHNPQIESVRLLLKAGADPNLAGQQANTDPLRQALISNCSTEIIIALIEAGADVNRQSSAGYFPFLSAILFNYGLDVVEAFLTAGANPHVLDYGDTALMYATLNQHSDQTEIFKLLLNEGVSVNARGATGQTALHWAVSVNGMVAGGASENLEIIDLLLNAGARLDVRDVMGKTPLMVAARICQNPETIRLLLEAGADGSLKCIEGLTAFDYAKENDLLVYTEEFWLLNESRF